MPPKNSGGGSGFKKRNLSLETNLRRQSSTVLSVSQASLKTMTAKPNQPCFSVAPLILEGAKLNKLQLNDLMKQHMGDCKVLDIQLSRNGVFTLSLGDVQSFNKMLNELSTLLNSNGQAAVKVYVPRSIQRIKDTEKVAFVKRVDLELPEDRVMNALKQSGLDVVNVTRLTNREGNAPTRTLKITFSDATNRNTFVRVGLQVDSMHFTAESATQNTKPVQCYMCMKYNHIAKYCKTKEQTCQRCGENHRPEQCSVADEKVKCSNCKGNHLATSSECTAFKEQAKRMQKLIDQYSTSNKVVNTMPALYNNNEFPALPNVMQKQQEALQKDFFDEIINVLSSKMERIIEETTQRLFHTLQKKIEKLEKIVSKKENQQQQEEDIITSESDSNEECQVTKYIKEKQRQNATTTTPKPNTNNNKEKVTAKQSGTRKQPKRVRSPNSSMESTSLNSKDMKTSNA